MARMEEWLRGLGIELPEEPTAKTYEKIKSGGLRTVEFNAFSPESVDEILERSRDFVLDYAPILFIYEIAGEKSWDFNVVDLKPVKKWIKETGNPTQHSILLSSQVSGSPNSFVGSVISDGKGKVIADTYHKPFVYKQNLVANGKIEPEFTAGFETEGFDLHSVWGHQGLSLGGIRTLMKAYETRRGYFEFIFGRHLGKLELVTNGYVPIDFFPLEGALSPKTLSADLSGRLRALNL